jgi:opacity protein-like surface antigen
MTRLNQCLIFVILTLLSVTAYTREMQFDANLLLTDLDAGGNDEFKSGRGLVLQYSYYLKEWMAADIGLLVSDKTLDQTRQDIVGQYRASIQTNAILLGIKPSYKFSTPYEVYGRLGLQLWRTELEVEEYFNDSIPEGKNSVTDSGYGYYASLGGAYYITENVMLQLELRHMKQLNLFEDESDYPFDLIINALSFGVGYRF